jgi:alginate O-acetyltransferase complex protein AlgI
LGPLLDAVRIGRESRTAKTINWFMTFHAVVLLWVFFRANSAGDAWYIYSHMFIDIWPISFRPIRGDVPLMLILGLMLVEFLLRRYPPNMALPGKVFRTPMLRGAVASVMFLFVVFLGEYDNHQFIYFVF